MRAQLTRHGGEVLIFPIETSMTGLERPRLVTKIIREAESGAVDVSVDGTTCVFVNEVVNSRE